MFQVSYDILSCTVPVYRNWFAVVWRSASEYFVTSLRCSTPWIFSMTWRHRHGWTLFLALPCHWIWLRHVKHSSPLAWCEREHDELQYVCVRTAMKHSIHSCKNGPSSLALGLINTVATCDSASSIGFEAHSELWEREWHAVLELWAGNLRDSPTRRDWPFIPERGEVPMWPPKAIRKRFYPQWSPCKVTRCGTVEFQKNLGGNKGSPQKSWRNHRLRWLIPKSDQVGLSLLGCFQLYYAAEVCCKTVGLVAIKGSLMLALTVQKKIARLKLEFSGSAVDTVFVLGLPWHSSLYFLTLCQHTYTYYIIHIHRQIHLCIYVYCIYIYIHTDMLQNLETSRPVPALQESGRFPTFVPVLGAFFNTGTAGRNVEGPHL